MTAPVPDGSLPVRDRGVAVGRRLPMRSDAYQRRADEVLRHGPGPRPIGAYGIGDQEVVVPSSPTSRVRAAASWHSVRSGSCVSGSCESIGDRTRTDQGRAGSEPPVCVVMAVTVDGTRDILGIRTGGGEGARAGCVFTELKNHGLDCVLVLVGDGLEGLSEAVEAVWLRAIVQTRVVGWVWGW